MAHVYQDLFDIEKRPGAGVALWTKAVERQLTRVREVNLRHRLHHSQNIAERRPDPNAEHELHADVYFLALAIRRVLLFHDALARLIEDSRLDEARREFEEATPDAKGLRDFYEHLDEYLLDDSRKHRDIPGRAAPVLHSRWDCDNVVVALGDLRVDVTLSAVEAIKLGEATASVWNEHLDRNRTAPTAPLPDDDPSRIVTVTLGVSTVIGGDDEHLQLRTGVLLGVDVREVEPDCAAQAQKGQPRKA